jgi:pyruvate/2-oxoglutarate dehydrogenase complex dihydrolipoamide dehydrogenase (E3) component
MSGDLLKVDVCVIGAGSGGLTVAAGAARMGATVVLVEKGEMGGECLNTGCVPSKALLAAAARAQGVREAGAFGIRTSGPDVDWAAVHRHVRQVIDNIAPHDSQQRFEGMGVTVIRAAGRFVDRRTLEAGGRRIRARYFVLATGSSPAVPEIPGLDGVDYRTNETIFAVAPVGHLVVIGGGPVGLEMAQAHRRLGAAVTVLEAGRCLARDDAEMADMVTGRLQDEGIVIHEGVSGLRCEPVSGGVRVRFATASGEDAVDGTHLLVAAGRRPNVDGLGLEAAGVAHGAQGVQVDARLRTSNRRIYAVGDVTGPYRFTHAAAYQAGIVIRNMLLRLPARVDYTALPWAVFTDPELAHVGLTEAEAGRKGLRVRVLRQDFAGNDRAVAERHSEGGIKVVVSLRGRVLGATIVGAHAGELIAPWVLAVRQRLGIGAMASLVLPYPTRAEAGKRAAGSHFEPMLVSGRMRRLVRLLLRLG